jgi:uncharacterized membrane protein YdbT with pleckstrin-like domain
MKRNNILWHDRKRNFLGLPWIFTVYALDKNRLFIEKGFFNTTDDEVRLYRITDISLTRSLWQKIIGTGTIHCTSADKTMMNFDITNIKHPYDAKELLSDLIETSRKENRVYARENMYSTHHDHGDGDEINPDMFDHEIMPGGNDLNEDDGMGDDDGNF